ncbi:MULTISPECIES: DNA-processing protein DprA [unclassified Breznakia]|uniref:DNA-processing protein DprA n=1 Tax=unclassified Breznakia TaxID=2623764 RepID=UPI00247494FA|nr:MULTISPECIES: DNA-processing protein DprA [unclassified Breznakia]MDH6366726.1 DNA processing protein [Breznakia sp. PH1-1]MDH6403887.1 DNA processing protein [Breznakia sp. PF1-11]MDH6411596.1 DNA processing protein [Breznakia sp. PFB1-11]MDH6413960.1 DNA processing protein [Breznakia sp. PFB1-14]MDH6416389.1 DNA processing protein [Breznakia sp. PFB1-4]
MRERLLYYSVKYDGDVHAIKRAILHNEAYESITYPDPYITILDDVYPQEFLLLKYPPYVLYYKGDISLLNKRKIAVVGSRIMTRQGRYNCETLMRYVNKEYVSVSGLAKGVDAYIHQLSLHTRKTIAIVGCGLDIHYPKCNSFLYKEIETNHLLLSEYPNGSRPFSFHFPLRNRLIAALGEKLIVIEASKRSGTMLTVNEAIELNKEVYVFPYSFVENHVSGCNVLIQEGANIIVDNETIAEL